MLKLAEGTEIYVAAQSVDLRKAINGLAALVSENFATSVNSGSVFVFYNRDFCKFQCKNTQKF